MTRESGRKETNDNGRRRHGSKARQTTSSRERGTGSTGRRSAAKSPVIVPESALPKANGLRQTGLEIVGDVPWGSHFCQFYQTRQDLLDVLVPYFRAGLEASEFCMWITSQPLSADEAKAALAAAVPDLQQRIAAGQIEILDYKQWYVLNGQFDADRVLQGWADKLTAARRRGFDGLRLTGNTFWLEKAQWQDFSDYEAAVDRVIGKHRMLALCTYSLDKCGAFEVMDVVRNHQFALIRQGKQWEMLRSAQREAMESALRESEERFRLAAQSVSDIVWQWNLATNEVSWYGKIDEQLGYGPDEFPRSIKAWEEIIHPDDRDRVLTALDKHLKEGLPYREEYRAIHRDGTVLHWLDSGMVQRNERGEPHMMVGAISNITERKQIENRLSYLASFPLRNPSPTMEVDLDGDIRYMNPAALRLFPDLGERGLLHPWLTDWGTVVRPFRMGQTEIAPRELTIGGRTYQQVFYYSAPDRFVRIHGFDVTDRKQIEQALQDANEQLQAQTEELQAQGEELHAQAQELAIANEDLQAANERLKTQQEELQSQAQDLREADEALRRLNKELEQRVLDRTAELSKANEALRQAGDYNRSLLEASLDPLVTIGPDGKITDVNAATEAVTGRTRRKLIGTDFSRYFTEPVKAQAGYQQVFQEGLVRDYPLEIRHKDGHVTPVLYNASVYKDTDGKVAGVFAAARDITERKRAEEALQEAHDQLEAKVRERTTELQQAYERLQTQTEELQAQQEELAAQTEELRTANKELHHHEQAVVEAKERWERTFHSVPDLIAILDNEHRIVQVNHAMAERLGTTPEQCAGLPCYKIVHGTDVPPAFCPHALTVKDGGEHQTEVCESRLRGEFLVSTTPLHDGDGQMIGSVHVARDITERKRAEEAVIRSRETFAELIERAPFGIYVVDSQFRIAQMNAGSQTGAFQNVRPVIGRDFAETMHILWPNPVAEDIIAVFRHTLETGESYYSPRFTNPRHDVEIVESYEWELHRMMLPDGQYGVVCYYFDSTRLRQAEEALRRSEARWNAAIESFAEGAIIATEDEQVIYWNPAARQMHGISGPDEFIEPLEKTPITFQLWTPDGNHMLELDEWPMRRVKRGETLRNLELRIRRLDQGWEKVFSYSGAMVDTTGGERLIFLTCHDLTELRQAEQAVRENEEEFRRHAEEVETLMNVAPVAIWVSNDPQCNHIVGNLTADRFYEAYEQENVSANVTPGRRFFHGGQELSPEELPMQQAAARGVDIRNADLDVLLPSGKWLNMLGSASPLRDGQGKVRGCVGAFVDATERKAREAQIARLTRLHAMLSRVNEAIVRTRDEHSLFDEVCGIVAEEGGFPLVWIGRVNDGQVTPAASSGPAEEYLTQIKVRTDGKLGRGPTGTCIRENHAVVNVDFVTDPAMSPWRQAAQRHGLGASAAFPLRRAGNPVAALTLYTPQSNAFDPEQVALIEALAADVSYALDTLQQQQALRKAHEDLQAQSEELTAANEELQAQSEELQTANEELREQGQELQASLEAQRRAADRLNLLSDTAAGLLAAQEPQVVVDSLCHRVMEFLDCQVFFNFLVDEQAGRLRLNACAGIPNRERKKLTWLDYGVAVCGCVARDGKRTVAEHIPDDSDERTALVKSYGVRAYACHPILAGSKVLGTVSFGTKTRDVFSPDEIDLMKAVTDMVAIAVQRQQTQQALRETRDYLNNLFDYANAPIIVWDRELKITRFNHAFEHLTGHPAEDVLGAKIDILFPQDSRAESLAHIQSATSGQTRWEVIEIPVLHVDGNMRTVLWNSANILALDGKTVVATIAQGQDITERKAMETQLRQWNEQLEQKAAERTADLMRSVDRLQDEMSRRALAEGKLRTNSQMLEGFFQHTITPLAFLDAHFNLVRVNEAYAKADGREPKYFTGKNHFDLYPHEENRAIFEQVVQTKQPYRAYAKPFAYPRDPQRVTYWNWQVTPVLSEFGSVQYLVLNLEDVTERQKAFEELEQRTRQLQHLTLELSEAEERERRRLAEILHDDLQQILAAAKFHLGILSNRVKKDRLAQEIVDQLNLMLKDAIDKSRSLSHELSPAMLYQSDLGETFQWLAQQMEAKHGLTIHVEPRGQVDAKSEALKAFLFRSAQELLFNVVKHAKVREVRLRVRRVRDQVRLILSDRGQGFNPQALGKTAGFGLLSIRERIELLGGRMKIKSAKGRGSTFLIAVPDPEESVDAQPMTHIAAAEASSSATQAASQPRVRVLLVDDHEVMREGLAALLNEQQDMEVTGQAGNGREAVDLAYRLEPDVVIMDAAMPVMGGDEATRQIKQYLPKTRIIALSMFDEPQISDRMRKAGAEVYLLKTAPSEELLAAIRSR